MNVEVRPLELAFRRPLRTAYGTLERRDLLLLELTAADGVHGRGEAAPLEPYDGVALGAVRDALEAYRPVLEGAEDAEIADVLAACRAVADLPQALAAVDLALWDLAGRRAGRPVAALLTASPAASVEVNATIAADSPPEAAAQAAAAVRAGFRCVKVKVGTPEDAERVRAVRAAIGPEARLRVDANGAWDVAGACAALQALAPFGLELAEEPVHGVGELREVQARSVVPVAVDESGALPGALEAGCAYVCLKIARCGGISGTLAAAARARRAGSHVYLASTFDGPIGIAAGLHAAAALGPLPACGLATLGALEGAGDPFPVRDGHVAVPVTPGLGVAT